MVELKLGRRALLMGAAALMAAGAAGCARREEAGAASGLVDLRDRPLAITPPAIATIIHFDAARISTLNCRRDRKVSRVKRPLTPAEPFAKPFSWLIRDAAPIPG